MNLIKMCSLMAVATVAYSNIPEKNKPNILFVLCDDLGMGDVNAFRSPNERNTGYDLVKKNGDPIGLPDSKILTPNLDRFASKGVVLTNFYSGSTVSGPSRCSLLTGMHTGNAQMSVRYNGKGEGAFRLRADDYTLAKMLKDHGYVTGVIGKYGMMGDGPQNITDANRNIREDLYPILPSNLGFDYTYGNLDHISGHFHFQGHDNGNKTAGQQAITWEILENSPKNSVMNVTPKSIEYSQDLFLAKAKDFLDRRNADKKPFFLYFAPLIPHAGLQIPNAGAVNDNVDFSNAKGQLTPNGSGVGSFKWYIKAYEERKWRKNHQGDAGHYGVQPFARAAHAAMVSRLDRDFGLLLKHLADNGQDKNTIIIFTSDNGPHNEGGADPFFFSNLHPLRGIKRDLTEGGIRMPTIMWGSPNIMPNDKAGKKDASLGAFWDMMPTISAWTGAKIPPAVQKKINGINLAGILNPQLPIRKHNYLYWEFPNKQAVRKGNWKALRLNANNPNSPVELYDLSKDPLEEKNLAKSQPEKLKQMLEIMRSATQDSPSVVIPN